MSCPYSKIWRSRSENLKSFSMKYQITKQMSFSILLHPNIHHRNNFKNTSKVSMFLAKMSMRKHDQKCFHISSITWFNVTCYNISLCFKCTTLPTFQKSPVFLLKHKWKFVLFLQNIAPATELSLGFHLNFHESYTEHTLYSTFMWLYV